MHDVVPTRASNPERRSRYFPLVAMPLLLLTEAGRSGMRGAAQVVLGHLCTSSMVANQTTAAGAVQAANSYYTGARVIHKVVRTVRGVPIFLHAYLQSADLHHAYQTGISLSSCDKFLGAAADTSCEGTVHR
jgi:hypothetical protein